MAAALLVGLLCDNEDEDEHKNRNVMTERLLRLHNDVLHFPDHMLISHYRLPRQLILNLVEELRPALERPARRHGAFPVVVQVINALRFFAKTSRLRLQACLRFHSHVFHAISGRSPMPSAILQRTTFSFLVEKSCSRFRRLF